MTTKIVEFGLEGDITDTVTFTVYGNGDYASDFICELIIDYWKSEDWIWKGVKLPSKQDIIEFIMNDEDLDDKDYYLSNIDTMFIDYNTMFDDKWFRFIQKGNVV